MKTAGGAIILFACAVSIVLPGRLGVWVGGAIYGVGQALYGRR